MQKCSYTGPETTMQNRQSEVQLFSTGVQERHSPASSPNMDKRLVLISQNILFSGILTEGKEICIVFGFSLCS
jgi:hypothetical protein